MGRLYRLGRRHTPAPATPASEGTSEGGFVQLLIMSSLHSIVLRNTQTLKPRTKRKNEVTCENLKTTKIPTYQRKEDQRKERERKNVIQRQK